MTRNPNMREAILSAAELLFSTQRLQCRVDPRHRAGSRRQSGQHHLSFQEQGRLAAGNLQAPLRADEQAPHRVAGGGEARARRSGPAGGDRAGLCAAGVFIEQRSCRRRRAVHAAARGDVGRRQRRGGPHHRGDLRRHHQRLHRGDRAKACRICRGRRSSGDRSSCSARSITPSSARSGSRGCRAAKPTAPIWRKRSSNSSRRRSPRCRRPTSITSTARPPGRSRPSRQQKAPPGSGKKIRLHEFEAP